MTYTAYHNDWEIVYSVGSFGKKRILIDGEECEKIDKNEYNFIDEHGRQRRVILTSSNILKGINLYIDNDFVEVTPEIQAFWYIIALIPAIALIVLGGAIGGGIGGASYMILINSYIKRKSVIIRLLLTIIVYAVAFALFLAIASIFLGFMDNELYCYFL